MIDQFKNYLTSHAENINLSSKWRSFVLNYIKSNQVNEVYLNHYRENVYKIANEFYSPLALLFTRDQQLERSVAAIKDHGLYDVLGKDYELMKGAAALSLFHSITNKSETAFSWLGKAGYKGDDLRLALLRCEENTGLKLFDCNDNYFICHF